MDRIEPPKVLDLTGNVAENWRRFRHAWECYLAVADPEEDKSDKYKSSLFLTVAGEESREIYNSFDWDDPADSMKLDKIVEKFQMYCEPKKNVTYERYCFFTCSQKSDQNIDQYLSELKQKARTCEFGTLQEGLLRDRIVCGIRDDTVRMRLLRDNDLTLSKAVNTCRASELALSQAKELNTSKDSQQQNEVDMVKRKFRPKPNKHQTVSKTAKPAKNHSRACNKCGKTHNINCCPAVGKRCYKCGLFGHFGTMCKRSRGNDVHEVEEMHASFEDTDFFVNTVDNPQERAAWIVPLVVNDSEILIKLDPGANTNIMSYDQWKQLKRRSKLQSTDVSLKAYGGVAIPVQGRVHVDISHKGRKYNTTFIITPKNDKTILGLQDCERMGLVRCVYEVSADQQTEQNSSDQEKLFNEYADVFTGLGCLPAEHHITVDENVTPVIEPCRKVPFALQDELKTELDRMIHLGVITEVTEPTEWVSAIVIVHKKGGKLRICLDPKNLNEAIRREHFKLPTREEIMSRFSGAKVFSKIDASCGFWQLKLDHQSSLLTTFVTPFGRFRFLRLPFGISSAPEVYHRIVHQLFENLPGVDTSMDDMIIWGRNVAEHDANLRRVLDRCRDVSLKLNKDKCELRVKELTFLGDRVTELGLLPDPAKVKAISDMKMPTEKQELQRFLGMINFLGKYIPDLSTVAAPLRKLLEKSSQWEWYDEHTRSWNELKKRISEKPVLQFFDQSKQIKVSSDASKCGLGAVLLQKHDNVWLPVAYASRAMTSAETRYAQIEKEALSICFAMERFHQYVYGSVITIETDHKPLVPIFKKGLNESPPRIQRFRLRLQKYTFNLVYTPGKEMYTADALSRNFPQDESPVSSTEEDIQVFVDGITASLPISRDRLTNVREETQSDPVLSRLKSRILSGWPNERENCPKDLLDYWNFRDELSVIDDVIFKACRVVVPQTLRPLMLQKLHSGHLGEEKCRLRARELLYWPSINKDLQDLIKKCRTCITYRRKQTNEPMLCRETATRPWQKVATDLFEFDRTDYVVVIDYYSNYPEVTQIRNQSSSTVVTALKAVFARHGVPDEVVSDNGPCYSSAVFRRFSAEWGFCHSTSSPRYPRSNGLAEKTVQIVKNILRKCKSSGEDVYLGLLAYRSTPLSCGYSPSQLLMGRHIQSDLPMKSSILMPSSPCRKKVLKEKQLLKSSQKLHHDRRARRNELKELQPGSVVRVQDENNWRLQGQVMRKSGPRSYLVQTDSGTVIRRNRRDLLVTPFQSQQHDCDMPDVSLPNGVQSRATLTSSSSEDAQNNISNRSRELDTQATCVTTRSGREVIKPKRLIEED